MADWKGWALAGFGISGSGVRPPLKAPCKKGKGSVGVLAVICKRSGLWTEWAPSGAVAPKTFQRPPCLLLPEILLVEQL